MKQEGRGVSAHGPQTKVPLMTAVGVGLSLLLIPWTPLFRESLHPVFAIILALALATIQLRESRLVWLGPRHSLAVTSAALLSATLPILVLGTIVGGGNPWFTLERTLLAPFPNVLEYPGFLAFIFFDALLSGLLAIQFENWIARPHRAGEHRLAKWHPGAWGPAGIVGGTTSLSAASVAVWVQTVIFPRMPPSSPGPSLNMLADITLAGWFVAGLGLIGPAIELIESYE